MNHDFNRRSELFSFLNDQTLRLTPGLRHDWEAVMARRLQDVWRRIQQDPATRNAFLGSENAPDFKNGRPQVTLDFDRIIKNELSELADLDGECDVQSETVNNKSNLEYLGHWAAVNHNLAACRELFRVADYLRIDWSSGRVQPAYVFGTPFHFKKFNVAAYRRQSFAIFQPAEGRTFLVCRVRELGLRVFLNLASRAEDNVDVSPNEWDPPSEFSPFTEIVKWLSVPEFCDNLRRVRNRDDEELLRHCNRYDLMAALFKVKFDTSIDRKDFDTYLETPVIHQLRSLDADDTFRELSQTLQAVIETLPLGLDVAPIVAVIKNDYGRNVSEKLQHELSEWFHRFFGLKGVFELEPALAAAAEILNIDPDRLSAFLVALNRNDKYDSCAMSPLSELEWNELSNFKQDEHAGTGFLRKTIRTSNRELMTQVKSNSGVPSPRHGCRLLKLLSLLVPNFTGTLSEFAKQLQQSLRRSGESLAKSILPESFPSGTRRGVFIQSCQEVQVAIAMRLLLANHKVVALTKDEILLEIDAKHATDQASEIQSLAEMEAERLLGEFAGPIDTTVQDRW